jgi:hypothetical protein
LIEEQASDFTFRIVVDAKHGGRKVNVTDVEAFCRPGERALRHIGHAG